MRRSEVTESIAKALKTVPYSIDARLFGSEARGDAHADSDIDLLILVDKPTVSPKDEDIIFDPLYQIELQTGILINPLIMPKREWGKMVTPFYINVEKEGVSL
ncbi:MAG: nucleotidyltransferase domain-containing protein [Bacteroidaceae bacterium]|nr:nucleotidyltransferase domain-containing protein [Bacteroidaceae bacterium]